MAQPNKGPRRQIICRVPAEVHETIVATAQRRGVSTSQMLADLAALWAGRPELVRELDQQQSLLTEELAPAV
jgi:hypothetical protein